jgi:hypothetical protein
MTSTTWRPLHHGMSPESVALHAEQRANGLTPLPVHLFLVDAVDESRHRTACDGGLGEWITGDSTQITCRECMEWAHA